MKKYRHFINTIVILFFLVILSAGGIFYIFQILMWKNENISKLTNYLDSEMNREGYVVSTQKLLQSLDGDINRVRSLIIPNSGDVEFIENLESIAKSNNLIIDLDSLVFENDPKAPQNSVAVLKVKAKTKGSWTNTYKFIAELEALPYKIKINSMLLSKNPENLMSDDGKKIIAKGYWTTSFDIGVLKYK